MKIYIGQDNLTLSLITNNDLTDAQTALIKYEKPDSNVGEFIGTANGSLVEYQVQANDFNIEGDWKMWVHITFTNGKVSIGEPSILKIYKQGT